MRICLGPFADGVKIHASVYECSCQLLSPGLQSIDTKGHWARRLIGLDQFQCLCCGEQGQKCVYHESVVPIVSLQILLQLRRQQTLVGALLSAAACETTSWFPSCCAKHKVAKDFTCSATNSMLRDLPAVKQNPDIQGTDVPLVLCTSA